MIEMDFAKMTRKNVNNLRINLLDNLS